MDENTVRAILLNPELLTSEFLVQAQTEALCLELVRRDATLFPHLAQPSESVTLAAVRRSGWLIKHVATPTEEMCRLAVQDNGLNLADIHQQTLEMVLTALKKNNLALEYVRLPVDQLAQPASGQLEAWLQALRVCTFSVKDSIIKVFHPLIDAIPLGKHYREEWCQPFNPGVTGLDMLTELASHMRRLSPSSDTITDFSHRVNRQVELALRAAVTTPTLPQRLDCQAVTL